MMTTIDTLCKEWLSLQPMSTENQQRLDQKFMLEFNYNSNHLEGNTLTYGQTKLLLMFGETSGDAKLRDYEEMKAHNVGLELTKREAEDKERPLTENFIRELNRTILVEDFYKTQKSDGRTIRYEVKIGQYKTRPNSVITATGEMFYYASPEETPAFMTDLVEWYNNEEKKGELSPIQLATILHYRYIRIHPFEDGNGRVARLLVNYVLHRHGYPMIIVQSKDKDNYLNILHKCDVEVGLNPSDGAKANIHQLRHFQAYMEDLLTHALTISIKAAKGESIEEKEDFEKKLSLLAEKAKQEYNNKENEKIRTKVDDIKDVINILYFPIRGKIGNALKPATNIFYKRVEEVLYLSKSEDKHGAQRVEGIDIMIKENDERLNKLLLNTNAIIYSYILSNPRQEYNSLLPQVYSKDLIFILKDDYYMISELENKKYNYNTFPLKEDLDVIIESFKKDLLQMLDKNINRKE